MHRPTESKNTSCSCGNPQCSICGSDSHGIAFKGGYICESCIQYIHSRT